MHKKPTRFTIEAFFYHDLIYHFLNDKDHTQIVSVGKKKIIQPHVLKHK